MCSILEHRKRGTIYLLTIEYVTKKEGVQLPCLPGVVVLQLPRSPGAVVPAPFSRCSWSPSLLALQVRVALILYTHADYIVPEMFLLANYGWCDSGLRFPLLLIG